MFDGARLTSRLTKAEIALEKGGRERGAPSVTVHVCPGSIPHMAAWALASYASWDQTALSSEKKLVTDERAHAGVSALAWFIALVEERLLTGWDGALDPNTWTAVLGRGLLFGAQSPVPSEFSRWVGVADELVPLDQAVRVEVLRDGEKVTLDSMFVAVMKLLTGVDHRHRVVPERDDWMNIYMQVRYKGHDDATMWQRGDERLVRRTGYAFAGELNSV